ncbi:hypothetical protein FQR65_LT16157 [Abscondita terminalis]|nr:hypothetical protein FQR65_LT16157 [Abscondita terminalis]
MSLYSRLAENLIYLSPSYYKQRKRSGARIGMDKKFLPKDAVFFDVGANVGAYIYALERHLDSENIYAFEPNPLLFKRLKNNFFRKSIHSRMHSPIKIQKPQFKIPVIKGHSNAARGTLQTSLKEDGEEKAITSTVTVIKLDDWAEKNMIDRIDFIKIDVEGNETYTIAGMIETILRLKPVLMIEIEQRHHKRPVWDYICYFERYGYSAHYLNRSDFKLVPLTEKNYASALSCRTTKSKAEAQQATIELQNASTLANNNIVSKNERAMAKAKLDAANAEVKLAQIHLSFTDIKAPFSGILSLVKLPVTQFPSISPPKVNITAEYPGANNELLIKSVNISAERDSMEFRGEIL